MTKIETSGTTYWKKGRNFSQPRYSVKLAAGVEQHLAEKDEKRDGSERKARDRPDGVAGELYEPRLAAEEQPRAQQVDHQERERHRQAEEEQHRRAAEHQPRRCVP